MEIVQSNTQAMLIIESNEEAQWYFWRKPWANTIAYIPLKSDLLDHSWNDISLTNNWVTLNTSQISWRCCWYFNWKAMRWTCSKIQSWPETASVWVKFTSISTSSWCWIFGRWDLSTQATRAFMLYTSSKNSSWALAVSIYSWDIVSTTKPSLNVWHLCTATRSSSNMYYLYLDWQLLTSWSLSPWTAWQTVMIGRSPNAQYEYSYWYMAEAILENRQWSASEILEYYNKTKKYFWIS